MPQIIIIMSKIIINLYKSPCILCPGRKISQNKCRIKRIVAKNALIGPPPTALLLTPQPSASPLHSPSPAPPPAPRGPEGVRRHDAPAAPRHGHRQRPPPGAPDTAAPWERIPPESLTTDRVGVISRLYASTQHSPDTRDHDFW